MLAHDRLPARSGWRGHLWPSLVVGAALLVVGIQWYRAATRPNDGDFFLHWMFGGRLLAGEFLYTDGLDVPYPPFWAVIFAPLSFLPLPVAKTLAFPTSLAALAVLLAVFDRLTRVALRLTADQRFWAAVAALAMAGRFIVRELSECGPNLALLALSWLAVDLWARGRDLKAGACLGLATALKCTPALFLLYFAWKRQWKLVASGAIVTVLLTLSPLLWQGPAGYAVHMQTWWSHASLAATSGDPSLGPLGPDTVQNLSLRPALARFLMRLPPGHPGRVDHPFYFEALDLAPRAAGWIAKLSLLGLAAVMALAFRHRVKERGELGSVWECAMVSTLILLFSPITWGQHCVGLLPALYLIARTAMAGQPLPKWARGVLAAYIVVILGLNREFVGREISLLLDSFHVTTLAMLGVLAIAWNGAARHRTRERSSLARGELRIAPLKPKLLEPLAHEQRRMAA